MTAESLALARQHLDYSPTASEPETSEPETPGRVWQVVPTAKRPQAPAWLIGTLVHEAIAYWRFPDYPKFDRWLESQAANRGLTDRQQVDHAIHITKKLLDRFKSWTLFQEIEQAQQRFHELPYSYDKDQTIETGYIDLLYRYDGRWTIIDFKTDKIKPETGIDGLAKAEGYVAQIKRYGLAVHQILGERPRLLICFLNGRDGIIVRNISGDSDPDQTNASDNG